MLPLVSWLDSFKWKLLQWVFLKFFLSDYSWHNGFSLNIIFTMFCTDELRPGATELLKQPSYSPSAIFIVCMWSPTLFFLSVIYYLWLKLFKLPTIIKEGERDTITMCTDQKGVNYKLQILRSCLSLEYPKRPQKGLDAVNSFGHEPRKAGRGNQEVKPWKGEWL